MNALSMLYVYIKSMFVAEEGQDLIEYALIIALFVLLAVAGLAMMATPLNALWANITSSLGGS